MNSTRSDVALKELCDVMGWHQLSHDYQATSLAPQGWSAAASLIVPRMVGYSARDWDRTRKKLSQSQLLIYFSSFPALA
jgi:hypothetical protein